MSFLVTLSPAKRLDFDTPAPDLPTSHPALHAQTDELISYARTWSADDIAAKMRLSPQLAALNYERFQSFKTKGGDGITKAALYAFQGDVYQGLDAASLTLEQALAAQDQVRILSGLYGVLRPLDLIQPYRLEMGTRLETNAGSTLYAYWGATLSQVLNEAAHQTGASTLLNLASQEYFKAVDTQALRLPVLTCHFKEMRDGKPKIISFNAKRARGLMARYILTQGAQTRQDLEAFDVEGYAIAPELSDVHNLTFLKQG